MTEGARRATNLEGAGPGDAPVGPEVDDLPASHDERDLEVVRGRIAEGREEMDEMLRTIKERLTLGRLARTPSGTLNGTAAWAKPGSKALFLVVSTAGALLLGFGVLFRLRMKRKARRKEDPFSWSSAFPQTGVRSSVMESRSGRAADRL